jgi:hypothetical protein
MCELATSTAHSMKRDHVYWAKCKSPHASVCTKIINGKIIPKKYYNSFVKCFFQAMYACKSIKNCMRGHALKFPLESFTQVIYVRS